MPKKLIRAEIPMCPECGSEIVTPMPTGSVNRLLKSSCQDCGHFGFVDWGHYAPETDDIAANIRRFAGDRDWEFEDGEPADLQGWADSIEAAPDIDGVIELMLSVAQAVDVPGTYDQATRLRTMADVLKGTK